MYIAISLEEIATLFEQNAISAERQSKATKGLSAARLLQREAVIWRQAANVLANTKLEKDV